MMESLVTYLVAAMVGWVPLYAHKAAEPPDDARARYESIARDAVTVAFDEGEEPLFAGSDARAQTALLMLSVASFESTFRKAIDDGGRLGDHGHSYCLMQIRVGSGVTREGWTGRQLVEDRKLCFRAALHLLHSSFNACREFPLDDRLGAYATGHCFLEALVSQSRIRRARGWWQSHPLPRSVTTES